MLRTLGGLELIEGGLDRPVPLLILAYLNRAAQPQPRAMLADLFWPVTRAADLDAHLSDQAYPLLLLLESHMGGRKLNEVQVSAAELGVHLGLEAAPSYPAPLLKQLEPLHDELKLNHVVRSVHTEHENGQLVLIYEVGKAFHNRFSGRDATENPRRRNLRAALHKLRQSPSPLVTAERTHVRSEVRSDLDALREALGRNEVEQARTLYTGPFLAGVEKTLQSTTFELGETLAEWIVTARQEVARELQVALLEEAETQLQRANRQDAARYAVDAATLHSDAAALRETEYQRLVDVLAKSDSRRARSLHEALQARGVQTLLPEEREIAPQKEDGRNAALSSSSSPPLSQLKPQEGLPRSRLRHFTGRSVELGVLKEYLRDSATRILQVGGRSEIGKTSLVVKALDELETDHANPFRSVYYVALRSDRFTSLDGIIQLVAASLGEASAQELLSIWRAQTPLDTKLEYLFDEVLVERPLLVVWDNAEVLLADDTLAEAHDDIKQFLYACLTRESRAVACLISRTTLKLPDVWVGRYFERMKQLELRQGLDIQDSLSLLKHLDSDGALGFAHAPKEALVKVATWSQGMPRLLQNVVGLLRNTPLLNVETVLDDVAAVRRLGEEPVARTLEGLSPDQKQVMLALAVLNQGVPLEAVAFCLKDAIDVRGVLTRLLERYLVLYDPASSIWSMLEPDLEAAYTLLGDDLGIATRRALHLRAAVYYEAKPAHNPTTLADLSPQLETFRHLVAAEAYERAARLIIDLHVEYLSTWGDMGLLTELLSSLEGKIGDEVLAAEHLNTLGRVYNAVGKTEAAIHYFQRALTIAASQNFSALSEHAIGNLGLAHYRSGLYDLARMYYSEGLRRVRAEGRPNQDEYLGWIGLCYYEQGELELGADYLRQAIPVSEALNNKKNLSIWYGSYAMIQHALGHAEEAKGATKRALSMCRDLNFKSGEASNLDNLGKMMLEVDDLTVTLALWCLAYSIHVQTQSPYQHDVKERLQQLLGQQRAPDRIIDALHTAGDALLERCTDHAYTFFAQRSRDYLAELMGVG